MYDWGKKLRLFGLSRYFCEVKPAATWLPSVSITAAFAVTSTVLPTSPSSRVRSSRRVSRLELEGCRRRTS